MYFVLSSFFFFFNDTATTEIYTLSLHDALPACAPRRSGCLPAAPISKEGGRGSGGAACGGAVSRLVSAAAGGNRPQRLDAIAADADIPVVKIDGRVAMPRQQPDLVADPEPVGGGGDRDPAMFVRGALIEGSGLVPDQRRPRIESKRLQSGIDNGALLVGAAHHRRPHEQTRPKSADGRAVAIEIAPIIGVHEDVGAALQFGIDAAFRLERKAAGTGPGHDRTGNAVLLEKVARLCRLAGRRIDRPPPFVPPPQVLGRAVIGLQSGEGEMRHCADLAGQGE